MDSTTRSRWAVTLVCLFTLLMEVNSMALSTQETLVVTSSDNPIYETTLVDSESATDEPMLPVKLLDMQVRSEVALRYSRTAVTTLVKNPAKRSQETTFRVLLPDTAFISGFSMTINEKKYDAYVKEKKEAKQIYSKAVSQGFSAAHIATKARDSNHFTVTVNVEGDTTVLFNLTYEELLTRRQGLYNLGINLHPGSVVANLTVIVHIREAQKITTIRIPEITTGNEIIPTEENAQNTKAIVTRSADGRDVTVVFRPDIEEQQNLMDLFVQKSKKRDDEESKGVIGLFAVQYDVDRTMDNEILVNDGYFVHFFAPSDLTPLEKYVVFVLDTSGSMLGQKIVQLREAMQIILGELHTGDYFSIVEFDTNVKVHYIEESSTLEKEHSKAFRATPENIAKAKSIVSSLKPGSLTNIFDALSTAINLVQETASKQHYTTEDLESRNGSFVTAVDKKLEPVVIFLTDGQPNVGESYPENIINQISERNSGANKASIFSLAFGEDADRGFLRKLSLRNDGFMRHIYLASDAALQLRDFYRQITSPLLAHVKFIYPSEQVKENSLTKTNFRMYYDGTEMVVAGKTLPSATSMSSQVEGVNGVRDKIYRVTPTVFRSAKEEKEVEPLPLERLWAYLTIKQLLDKRDAAEHLDEPKEKEDAEKKALELALQYAFVTALTSLVVVKPNDTAAVDAESVDKDLITLSTSFGTRAYSMALGRRPAARHRSTYQSHQLSSSSNSYSALSGSSFSSYPYRRHWYPTGNSGGLFGRPAYHSSISPAQSFHTYVPTFSTRFSTPTLPSAVYLTQSSATSHAEPTSIIGLTATAGPVSTVEPNSITNPSATTKPTPTSEPVVTTKLSATSATLGFAPMSTVQPTTTINPTPTPEPLSTSTNETSLTPESTSTNEITLNAESTSTNESILTDESTTANDTASTAKLPLTNESMLTNESTTADTTSTSEATFTNGTALTAEPKLVTEPTATTSSAPTTTKTLNSLLEYGLEDYLWVQSVLEATTEELKIQVNSTYINLKLLRNIDDLHPSTEAVTCDRATDGAVGVCVYLSQCQAARNITAEIYASTYCFVQDKYAGVCCPSRDGVPTIISTTTGSSTKM